MVDTFSRAKRSWIMKQVKSNGNRSTEQKLITLFRREKITGWRRKYPLFGQPDFVLPEHRVAIFVDGCFWHGHPQKCRIPETNRDYWISKINRNIDRDRIVNRTLRLKGWKVLRIWEHSLCKTSTVNRVKKALATHEQ